MRHGDAPIESHLIFPSGDVGITVGGPILRVWDLNMGRCIRALSNHQKTVTCATFDGTRGRVLTGGLDAMVKVYDVEEWKVVHSMRYPAPVLSLAVSVSILLCWTIQRFSVRARARLRRVRRRSGHGYEAQTWRSVGKAGGQSEAEKSEIGRAERAGGIGERRKHAGQHKRESESAQRECRGRAIQDAATRLALHATSQIT